jgi:hypothetical protein
MECYNSIVINAPADEVWNNVKNFGDLSSAKTVVSKVDILGDKSPNEIGAQWTLNDAIEESLLSVAEGCKKFTDSIDDGPGPVSKDSVGEYVGEVSVYLVSENNTSFAIWASKWASSKEGGVKEFCSPVYHALLQNLKSHFLKEWGKFFWKNKKRPALVQAS